VDCAEVGVLEQGYQVSFGCLLEGQHGLTLETDLLFEFSGNLAYQSLEGKLADKQVGLNKK
jgi:hypothetical protein